MKEKIVLITSSFLTQIISVIGGIIITRNYIKSDLGTYQQGVLLYSVIAIIASIGAPKAIYYFGGRHKNLKHVLSHILILVTISSIVFSILLYFSWNAICNLFSNQELQYLVIYIIALLFLRTMETLFQPVSILTKKVVSASYLNIWTNFLQIIILFIMCYYKLPLSYLYSSLIFVLLIRVAYTIDLVRKSNDESWQGFDTKLTIDICKYSFPLLLSIITLLFARRIDGFIISSFSDPETMAIYSRGALEIPLTGIVVWNIANLCMPKFVEYYKEQKYTKILETLNDEIKRICIITFPVFFTLVLISKDFIVFLYTKEYLESVPVFIIYLFLLPVQIFAFDTILQAMNKTSSVFYISIASVVSNVIISIILYYIIGMSGPAIGTVFSIIVTNALCLYYINKNLSNSFKNLLPWGFLIKVTIICTILLVAFYPLLHITRDLNSFTRIMVLSPLLYIFQIGSLWKFNMIMDKDKKLIQSKISGILNTFKK